MWPTGSPHEEVGCPPTRHMALSTEPSCSPVSLSSMSEPPCPVSIPPVVPTAQPSPALRRASAHVWPSAPPTWAMTTCLTAQTEDEVTWARWTACPLTPVLPLASVTVNFCSGPQALVLLHQDPLGTRSCACCAGKSLSPHLLGAQRCSVRPVLRSAEPPRPPTAPGARPLLHSHTCGGRNCCGLTSSGPSGRCLGERPPAGPFPMDTAGPRSALKEGRQPAQCRPLSHADGSGAQA